MADFYEGQSIECVDARPRANGAVPLTEGKIYRVAKIIRAPGVGIGLQLREVPNPPGSAGFWADRFRVAEDDDDHELAVFRRILQPA